MSAPTQQNYGTTLFSVLLWQFAMVEVMVTSLLDGYYQKLVKYFRRKEVFVLVVCITAFLLGIPCVMQVKLVI